MDRTGLKIMSRKIVVEVFGITEGFPVITQNSRSVLVWRVGFREVQEVFYDGAGHFFYFKPHNGEKVICDDVVEWCELPEFSD